MDSIKKRVIYGVSGNVVAQIVNVLIQFAGVPLLLNYWGVKYYGEWLVMFTIPAYIEISDFGLGGSATAEMIILKESGEWQKVKEILQSSFWFILLVGGIPFIILYLSSWIIPWYNLLNFHSITEQDFNLAFPFLIGYVYLSLFLTIPVGYYRVEKIYHRERYIAIAFKVIEFSGLFLVVTSGHGVALAAFVYLGIKTIYFLTILLDLRIRFAEFRLGFFKMNFKKIRHLFKPSLALMIIFLSQNILVQGLTTSIGIVLGPAQVVVYNTTRTLMNMAKQIVNIINFSFISEFSYAFGLGNRVLLNELFHNVQKTNIGISFISVAGILIFGQYILNIWTHGEIKVIQPFFILFGVSVFLNSWWSGGLILLVATNKQYKIGKYFLGLSVLILTFILFFIEKGGLTFTASMLVTFEVIMLFIVFQYCKTILSISPWEGFGLNRREI